MPGCGAAMDKDCPGCGNGVVEAGETCDPPDKCRAAEMACTSDQSTVRTPSGDAGACTFVCTETSRSCGVRRNRCFQKELVNRVP